MTKTVKSQDIHYDVNEVLNGARKSACVAVVYINAEGKAEVAGSHGSPIVMNLLRQGLKKVANPK